MYDHSPAYSVLVAIDTKQLSLTKRLHRKEKDGDKKVHQGYVFMMSESGHQTHHDSHEAIHTEVYVRVTGHYGHSRAVRELLYCRESPVPIPVPATSTSALTRIITAITIFIFITIGDAVTFHFPNPSSALPPTQQLDTRCERTALTLTLT
jgi:hypothetical protein